MLKNKIFKPKTLAFTTLIALITSVTISACTPNQNLLNSNANTLKMYKNFIENNENNLWFTRIQDAAKSQKPIFLYANDRETKSIIFIQDYLIALGILSLWTQNPAQASKLHVHNINNHVMPEWQKLADNFPNLIILQPENEGKQDLPINAIAINHFVNEIQTVNNSTNPGAYIFITDIDLYYHYVLPATGSWVSQMYLKALFQTQNYVSVLTDGLWNMYENIAPYFSNNSRDFFIKYFLTENTIVFDIVNPLYQLKNPLNKPVFVTGKIEIDGFIYPQKLALEPELASKFLKIYGEVFKVTTTGTFQQFLWPDQQNYDPNKKNLFLLGDSLYRPTNNPKIQNNPYFQNSYQKWYQAIVNKYPSAQYNYIFKAHPRFKEQEVKDFITWIETQIPTTTTKPSITYMNNVYGFESFLYWSAYQQNLSEQATKDGHTPNNSGQTVNHNLFTFQTGANATLVPKSIILGFQATSTVFFSAYQAMTSSFNYTKAQTEQIIAKNDFVINDLIDLNVPNKTMADHGFTTKEEMYNYNLELIQKHYATVPPALYFDLNHPPSLSTYLRDNQVTPYTPNLIN